MIKPLTSLRFFFAFMVFLHHLWFLLDENQFLHDLYDNVLKEGFIGVSFFFILSGFVLSYNYYDKFINGETKFRQFSLARIARIYPLHLLTLLIAIPLSLGENAISWGTKFMLHLFLLQSFVPSGDTYFFFNSVSWSISNEMFFYLMFPLLVFFLLKKQNVKIALGYILLIPILIFITNDSYHEAIFDVNPLTRIADFIIGIILYKIYIKRKDTEILNRKSIASIVEIGSIVLLAVFLSFHQYIPIGYRYSCYYWLPMTLLIYTFSYSKGIISNILSNRILVFLGEISFGFYMIHMLAIKYYEYLPQKFAALKYLLPKSYIEAIVVFVVTLILSMITYKWYETPANKFIKKKLGSKL